MRPMESTIDASGPVTRGRRTRQEILKTAVDIASVEGLEGLTIGRLAQELKMSKSGLFAHFGSKEELQLAAVDMARAIFVEEVADPAFTAERGIVRLEAMLERWLSYVERSVFSGGCFFAAASAEFDDRPGPVRDMIATLTKSWLDALEEEARFAQKLSQFKAKLDPAQLAFEVHALAQEANWAYRLLDDKRAFDRARAGIRQRITDAATASGLRALPEMKPAGKKSG